MSQKENDQAGSVRCVKVIICSWSYYNLGSDTFFSFSPHSILKLYQFEFNLHRVIPELWVVNGAANDNKEARTRSANCPYYRNQAPDYPCMSWLSWAEFKCMSNFSIHFATPVCNISDNDIVIIVVWCPGMSNQLKSCGDFLLNGNVSWG